LPGSGEKTRCIFPDRSAIAPGRSQPATNTKRIFEVSGRAYDIVHASAKALVNAINLIHRV
jgi:hypothetical protein